MYRLTVFIFAGVVGVAVAADLPDTQKVQGKGNPFIEDIPLTPMRNVGAGMPPQAGQSLQFPPPMPIPDPIPQQFTDNKQVFDSLSVVGINAGYALLRYQSGTGSSGPSVSVDAPLNRVVSVADGEPIWLGGRRYLVKIASLSVRIIAVPPTGNKAKSKQAVGEDDVVWSGDLDAPRGYNVSPNPQDLR